MPTPARLMNSFPNTWLRHAGLFLLPFVMFFALAGAATPARADTPAMGPYSAQGTFDCLGDYDWGCKIIGFLFEGTSVTYIKDGAPVTDNPGVVEAGLRQMMKFFSNAILIIASLKLLFELIQMVAETAHSGTVGGKETNQLWAPIRLVVAIGLLVPLSSGMNSAQYIIIQVAKWGSGMGSQAWKVFATALTNEQSLASPTAPRIDSLAANTLRDFVCARMINYYTTNQSFQDSELVMPRQQYEGTNQKLVFGNQRDNNVCGEVIFHMPELTDDSNDVDVASAVLTQKNIDLYNNEFDELKRYAEQYANYFLPSGGGGNDRSTQDFENAYNNYQTNVNNAFNNSEIVNLGKTQLEKITTEIKKGADSYGWTTAGTWFLAITRAQAAITNGSYNIPQSTAPNLTTLKNYPDAYAAYQKFLEWYGKSKRTQDLTPADHSVGAQRVKIAKDDQVWWTRLASMTGRQVIDFILTIMDGLGTDLGLWGPDPIKALGDLGGSTNPFGELTSLGQKHIRLGLDYIGTAIALNFTGSLTSYLPGVGGAVSATMFFVGTIFLGFAFLFLIGGALLAFIVPMLPFLRFFFAIITWLGTILEAMICAPFLALAHLTPKGEGFSGQHTRQGYFLIFQILLRPTLSLFGMIASIIMFYVGTRFLNSVYYDAVRGVAVFEGGMVFIAKVVFTIFYIAIIYILANASFKMMEQIPKHALRWMGGSAAEETHEEHAHSSFVSTIGPALAGQAIHNYASLGPNVAKKLAKQPKTPTAPNPPPGVSGAVGGGGGGNNGGGGNAGGGSPSGPSQKGIPSWANQTPLPGSPNFPSIPLQTITGSYNGQQFNSTTSTSSGEAQGELTTPTRAAVTAVQFNTITPSQTPADQQQVKDSANMAMQASYTAQGAATRSEYGALVATMQNGQMTQPGSTNSNTASAPAHSTQQEKPRKT